MGNCDIFQEDLSALADHALALEAMPAVTQHLEGCQPCRRRLSDYRDMGEQLRALASAPPAHLALRLRVVASHQSVHGQQWLYWRMRLRETVRSLALPAALGTAAALVLFSALAGGVRVRATNDPAVPDVQVGVGSNPPRVARMADYDIGSSLLVDAQIDAGGHVYGYRVISGRTDAAILSRLNNQLLMSVFDPATTVFGQPTNGSLLVSFSTVDVRG